MVADCIWSSREAYVSGSLREGQKVSFDLEKDRQGRSSATNLRPA